MRKSFRIAENYICSKEKTSHVLREGSTSQRHQISPKLTYEFSMVPIKNFFSRVRQVDSKVHMGKEEEKPGKLLERKGISFGKCLGERGLALPHRQHVTKIL